MISENGLPRSAAQQFVELLELAAFAFVAHPETLVRIPEPRPVEEVKDARSPGTVALVQIEDPFANEPDQLVVTTLVLLGPIAEISQEGEAQICIPVSDIAKLQPFEQIGDLLRVAQERGDHGHGTIRIRDAFQEIEAGEGAGSDKESRGEVHERNRHLRRGDDSGDQDNPQPPVIRVKKAQWFPENRECCRRDPEQRADVDENGEALHQSRQESAWRKADFQGALELRFALVDKIKTDMGGAGVGSLTRGAIFREADRLMCNLVLVHPRLARECLNAVAIAVAGRKIHLGIDSGRVGAERLLDEAHRFNELSPVDCAERAQAPDAVADEDLIGRLDLVVDPLQLFASEPLVGEAVLDPALHGRQLRALPVHPGAKLFDELVAEGRGRGGHFRENVQDPRLLFARSEETIGPEIGEVSVPATAGDMLRDPSEAFDQPESEHDGHGPQFTQREGADRLVRGDKVPHAFRIDMPVRVGNQFESDGIDPGKPRFRSIEETRQFPAVGLRKMPARGADLLLDEIEVVQEPFSGRSDVPGLGIGGRHEIIDLGQDLLIFRQSQQQSVRPAFRVDAVFVGHRHRMLAQLLDAEKFIPHREGTGSRDALAGHPFSPLA
jgi:hypothetical protein